MVLSASFYWLTTTHLVLDGADQAVRPPVHTRRSLEATPAFKNSISDWSPLLHLKPVYLLIDFLSCLEGQSSR